eukprot:gene12534-biopygen7760
MYEANNSQHGAEPVPNTGHDLGLLGRYPRRRSGVGWEHFWMAPDLQIATSHWTPPRRLPVAAGCRAPSERARDSPARIESWNMPLKSPLTRAGTGQAVRDRPSVSLVDKKESCVETRQQPPTGPARRALLVLRGGFQKASDSRVILVGGGGPHQIRPRREGSKYPAARLPLSLASECLAFGARNSEWGTACTLAEDFLAMAMEHGDYVLSDAQEWWRECNDVAGSIISSQCFDDFVAQYEDRIAGMDAEGKSFFEIVIRIIEDPGRPISTALTPTISGQLENQSHGNR